MTLPETRPDPVIQLAVALSAKLTRADNLDIVPVIVDALDDIAEATFSSGCQLVQFSESGAVVEICASATHPGRPAEGLVIEDWLTDPLARGEVVSIAAASELPIDAIAARGLAEQTGDCSVLGVPASAGGQVICALVLSVSAHVAAVAAGVHRTPAVAGGHHGRRAAHQAA